MTSDRPMATAPDGPLESAASVENWLAELQGMGVIGELDRHFAEFLCELTPPSAELVLAAGLVSRATGDGHVCLPLTEAAGRPIGAGPPQSRAPDLAAWRAALRTASVVGQPGDFRPLILDHRDRLYLYRYWDYERRVAEDLLQRAAHDEPALPLGEAEAALFSAGPPRRAAQALLRHRLTVISGPPGSGKTTLVTALLALLLGRAGSHPPAIALAAPTGKAAARLQQSMAAAQERLGLSTMLRQALPAEALTLHRLLGARPDSVSFRHGPDRPLPLDVLVVDEASMVDLPLMAKTLAALPPHARLILLGDHYQLAAVQAGAVLADICGPAREEGGGLATPTPTAGPLQDCVVFLSGSHRFGQSSGIGRLAQLIQQGASDGALALLQEGGYPDLLWLSPEQPLPQLLEEHGLPGTARYFQLLRDGAPLAELLAALDEFRILCPQRGGPWGLDACRGTLERSLRQAGRIVGSETGYPGQPVMVTRNDYRLRLFNGDVGVTLPAEGDAPVKIAFVAGDGQIRHVAPSQLPDHEIPYAMTVHKAQGSEFEEVLLILPDADNPLLSRELIYTAITRARRRVLIRAREAVWLAALARRERRASGLAERLW